MLCGAKHLKSEECESETRKYSESHDVLEQISTSANKLVPLRRALETHFDDLVRIGDVIPASVCLPTIGNNLNESATERGFRDVRDAFAVGFDI